jgi:hypothetical protein
MIIIYMALIILMFWEGRYRDDHNGIISFYVHPQRAVDKALPLLFSARGHGSAHEGELKR